ncbi:MAG: UDP-glucose 4-epimerase GalE, partial [Thermomonas sp.]
ATLCGGPVPSARVDVRDRAALREVFQAHRPDAVLHFAALKAVGESWARALDYHDNNIGGLLSVLGCMRGCGVERIVFSSSATVYGSANTSPISEDATIAPENPYGRTKAFCEHILLDTSRTPGGPCVALLRYFNPVGAHPSGLIGENPTGIPNNLVPYVCQVASGRLPLLRVVGSDYPTIDGTGVRDYVHVVDLAAAHIAALDVPAGNLVVNLGRGEGHSVLQVVSAFEQVSGRRIALRMDPRREGDVAECYASPALAQRVLGWRARHDLEQMCKDAWLWECRRD